MLYVVHMYFVDHDFVCTVDSLLTYTRQSISWTILGSTERFEIHMYGLV